MPVGGGKFTLEKTWRTTGTGSQTFNTSGNYPIPYGKNRILVSGKGGDGNPAVPSSLGGYNPSTPGNPVYNPPSGTNAVYNPYYPPAVVYNPYYPPEVVYNPYYPPEVVYNPYYPGTDVYNAISGGNIASYNPGTPGTAIYNAPGTGSAYAALTFVCEPTGGGAYNLIVERYAVVQYGGAQYNPVNNAPYTQFDALYLNTCPAPYNQFYSSFFPGGGFAGNNPAESGNPNYNAASGGNYSFTNAGSGGNFAGYNAASGGNFVGYNAASGGNLAGYNAVVPGNYAGTNFVAGNANYNAVVPAAAGSAVNVLGINLPGGTVGATAPFVSATVVNPYSYPDGSTYPVVVVPGSYVTITSE